MIPRIFGRHRFSFETINSTLVEYAARKFGKELVIIFPFSMINCAKFINEVYPHSIPLGLLDDIDNVNPKLLQELGIFDFIILYCNSISNLISFRKILKRLKCIKHGLKTIVILGANKNTSKDDLELFIEMSRIYDYRPTILAETKELIDSISIIFSLRKSKKCITEWFNYSVTIYIPDSSSPNITVLQPIHDIANTRLLTFRDCMALLCHSSGDLSASSIIRYIYESSLPVLKIGDVFIDEEFLAIVDSIIKFGSIRATSKLMGLSYTRIRKVIKELEKLEKALGIQLIEIKRGGSEHGCTTYTHAGQIVIDNLRELYGELVRSYSRVISSSLRGLGENGVRPICAFPLSI